MALERGDGREALEPFETAHSQQPQATSVVYTLALAHLALGNAEQAQRLFEEVPRNYLERREVTFDDPLAQEVGGLRRGAMAHEHRGLKAAARKQYGVAAAELAEAIALDGNRLDARHNLALAYLHLGRSEEARVQLREVLARDPEFASSHLLLGLVLRDDGSLDSAVDHLRRALELDPSLTRAETALREIEALAP